MKQSPEHELEQIFFQAKHCTVPSSETLKQLLVITQRVANSKKSTYSSRQTKSEILPNYSYLASKMAADTTKFSETMFFASLPTMLKSVFLSQGLEYETGAADPIENPSVLDTLDLAFLHYKQDKFKTANKLNSKLTGFFDSAGLLPRGFSNANTSRHLEILQLNWSESLQALDCLLSVSEASFVSLILADCLDASRRRQQHEFTLSIREVLPEHTVQDILHGHFDRLGEIYHNLSADRER